MGRACQGTLNAFLNYSVAARLRSSGAAGPGLVRPMDPRFHAAPGNSTAALENCKRGEPFLPEAEEIAAGR